MATILDYLKENKHKSFSELRFNELDIACLNELGYIPFELLNIEGLNDSFTTTLKAIISQDKQLVFSNHFLVTKERQILLEQFRDSIRFEDLTLSHYVSETNPEYDKQFAAMVFSIPRLSHQQIVFRGTDDTIIGWKEDFQLTYQTEIASHRSAIGFVKTILASETNSHFVLSGHSKGGNLALYTMTRLSKSEQNQISSLYLYDSLGISETAIHSEAYLRIRHKIYRYIPQESIVGVMLYHDVTPKIVASLSSGIMQHAMTNWLVTTNAYFSKASQLSSLSLNLEYTFSEWIKVLSKQELKLIVDTFLMF